MLRADLTNKSTLYSVPYHQDMMVYKHSLHLYKHFNDQNYNETWINQNFQQNNGQRNEYITFFLHIKTQNWEKQPNK